MIPYTPVADDESFVGEPLRGATWRRLAAGAQHLAGTRSRLVAAGYCLQRKIMVPFDIVMTIPVQATPWERKYAIRVTIAYRSATNIVPAGGCRLDVVSTDLAGGLVSPSRPTTLIPPPTRRPEWEDDRQTVRPVPLRWPVAAAAGPWPFQPETARVQSGWHVHEPAAGLLAVPDRLIQLRILNAGGASVEALLDGYCIVGYDDREEV